MAGVGAVTPDPSTQKVLLLTPASRGTTSTTLRRLTVTRTAD